jgi:hypothetical protein
MRPRMACCAVVAAVFLDAAIAVADAPKPTQAEARAKIEAQVLAQAQTKCAKDGKVALGQHVNGAFLIKCVSPDDPEYKAQQNEKPAQ